MSEIKPTFDCVAMKNEIHRKIAKELAGLTVRQQRRVLDQRLAQDPQLAAFVKKLKILEHSHV